MQRTKQMQCRYTRFNLKIFSIRMIVTSKFARIARILGAVRSLSFMPGA